VVYGRTDGLGVLSGENLIINGDFRINQRDAVSGATVGSGAYFLDRWQSAASSNAVTWTGDEQGRVITIPAAKAIKTTLEQRDVPAGAHVLSWTGTATARVYNAGASLPAYAASPVLVTIDGTANVVIEATAGTLSKVKLERGNVATPHEARPYGEELGLCQRYYEKSYNLGTAIGTATNAGAYMSTGNMGASTTSYILTALRFQVRKRAAPTILTYDKAGTAGKMTRDNVGVGASSENASVDHIGETGARLYCTGSNAQMILFHYTADAEL